MIFGFTLNENLLLECDVCHTTFNDEAEAKRHYKEIIFKKTR